MAREVRNPWGGGEWEGDWGDKSPLWKEHPRLARICGFEDKEDGAFWMSWGDACAIFARVDVCARASGMHDLQLDLKEGDGLLADCLGPLKGCCAGCVAYWCCCRGCDALYSAGGGDEVTVSIKGEEKRAYDDAVGNRLGSSLAEMAESVQNI